MKITINLDHRRDYVKKIYFDAIPFMRFVVLLFECDIMAEIKIKESTYLVLYVSNAKLNVVIPNIGSNHSVMVSGKNQEFYIRFYNKLKQRRSMYSRT